MNFPKKLRKLKNLPSKLVPVYMYGTDGQKPLIYHSLFTLFNFGGSIAQYDGVSFSESEDFLLESHNVFCLASRAKLDATRLHDSW